MMKIHEYFDFIWYEFWLKKKKVWLHFSIFELQFTILELHYGMFDIY